MVEHLPIDRVQLGAETGLEHLLSATPLHKSLRHYLVACLVEGKSPATVGIYRQVVCALIDYALAHNLPVEAAKVPTDDIRLYLLSLRERGLRSASINGHYRALRTFFGWLEREGQIPSSPMARSKPPKVEKLLVKPFSRQDIDNLLGVCAGATLVNVRNRAIVLLFLDTGLRLAELSGIQLGHIDFTRGVIRVMGKGAKERLVRMGNTTQKALLKYLLIRKDQHGCLWVTQFGEPMSARGAQVMIKRLCRYAEINGPTIGGRPIGAV